MWFLAFRYLIARKRQTILTLLGVMLGTTTFVVFAGMMTGFQGYIINQLVNNDAHVRISVREEIIQEHSLDKALLPDHSHVFWISPPSGRRDSAQIDHPTGWFERLERDDRVLAFSPQFSSQVIFTRGKASISGRLIGSNPSQQVRVSNIAEYMVSGSFEDIGSSGKRLVLGDQLLETLGARVGESLMVSAGKSEPIPFKIIGSFDLGIRSLDATTAFGSLVDVQDANLSPSKITDIAIRLIDVENASEVARQWSHLSNDKVQSWDEANANILSVFSIQNFMKDFVSVSILIVAAFGIYNILNILVNQKRKDIGILRSIGYGSSEIVLLFLVQGIFLGAGGGALGLGSGFLLCKYLETIEIGGMVESMMISYSPGIYWGGFAMALFASGLSSLLPAWAAGQLEPIDIVRSGD